jgi:hypothetical protein
MVVLLVTFGYEIRSSRTNLSGKGARGNGCGTDPPSDAVSQIAHVVMAGR